MVEGENAGCTALDKMYHIKCFVCTTCGKYDASKQLTYQSFSQYTDNEVEGQVQSVGLNTQKYIDVQDYFVTLPCLSSGPLSAFTKF